jgi:hypothetical protein
MLTLQELSCFHFQFLVWSENTQRLNKPQKNFTYFRFKQLVGHLGWYGLSHNKQYFKTGKMWNILLMLGYKGIHRVFRWTRSFLHSVSTKSHYSFGCSVRTAKIWKVKDFKESTNKFSAEWWTQSMISGVLITTEWRVLRLRWRNDFLHGWLKKSNPCTGLDRPWSFQEAEAATLHDNRHMKLVTLSARRYGRRYHKNILLVHISVSGWVDSRGNSPAENFLRHHRKSKPRRSGMQRSA